MDRKPGTLPSALVSSDGTLAAEAESSFGYMSWTACVYPHLEYKRPRLSSCTPSCTLGLFAMSAPGTDKRPGNAGCSLPD